MVQHKQKAGKRQDKRLGKPFVRIRRDKETNNVDEEKQHTHTEAGKLLYRLTAVFHLIKEKGKQQKKNRTDQQEGMGHLNEFGI